MLSFLLQHSEEVLLIGILRANYRARLFISALRCTLVLLRIQSRLLPESSSICHDQIRQPLLILLHLIGESCLDNLARVILRDSLVAEALGHHVNGLELLLGLGFAHHLLLYCHQIVVWLLVYQYPHWLLLRGDLRSLGGLGGAGPQRLAHWKFNLF